MDLGRHPGPALLEVRGLSKSFGTLRALQEVDFTLRAGEVHALLGENGAGKSTLIKVVTGTFARDAGVVRLDGIEVAPRSAKAALDAGIATVYQEVNLLPNLSVAQNLYLGRQPTLFGIVRETEMRRRATALLAEFDLRVDVAAPLGTYSVAVQHITAIARAVDLSARVLILDEPTASLDRHEVEVLFGVIRKLAARGIGVIFVTHFLNQVYQISQAIEDHHRLRGELPEALSVLSRTQPRPGLVFDDPVTHEFYGYRTLDWLRYELCATFDTPDSVGPYGGAIDPFWRHGAGRTCFTFEVRKVRRD